MHCSCRSRLPPAKQFWRSQYESFFLSTRPTRRMAHVCMYVWGSIGRPLEVSGPGGSVERFGEFLDAIASLATRDLPVKIALEQGPQAIFEAHHICMVVPNMCYCENSLTT